MKYMLVAGEPSGDLHASALIKALREIDDQAEFIFLGGDLMAQQAGSEPAIHYTDMAFMGFSEVIRHLPRISKNMQQARRMLREERPDVFIPVDYPGFNLKMVREAHKLGIKCCWYISPKLWAWKAWRVKMIRRTVDKMLCIFPFEPKWYAQRGYDRAVYVGNPTVDEIDAALASAPSRKVFLEKHRLRDRPIIALLPGSRRGEIRCNLPVMDAAAKMFPQYTIVVGGAPGISDDFYDGLTKFAVVRNATHDLLAHAHAAIVTSGTATLEAAVAAVPQVVVYRSNGSKIAYNLMKKVLHVSYVSLPNLIADRRVVPELLLHDCTPERVAEELMKLTPEHSAERIDMLRSYAEIGQLLEHPCSKSSDAAGEAAQAIYSEIISNQ